MGSIKNNVVVLIALLGAACAGGVVRGQTPYRNASFAQRAVDALAQDVSQPRGGIDELSPPAAGLPWPPSEAIAPGSPQAAETNRFPPLPPDPNAGEHQLPPLHEELWLHGGSYLYHPEGDRLNWPADAPQPLRLPEDWQKPLPLTLFSEFLGADPIETDPKLYWPGGGYAITPEFVGYGAYEVFGTALEQNNQRQDTIGHQLFLELDLSLSGTERFHVQFRPLGEGASGGSYYRFNDPASYVDNSTAEPQRYWFEGELHSMFSGFVDPFSVLDYRVVVGKFPFALHNFLLMNDEIQGVVLSKNTKYLGGLSNLNWQAFYGFNDVDTFGDADGQLLGLHASADYQRTFYELTYAFVAHEFDSQRNTHYAALSRTKLYGPLTVAGRGFFKWGDQGGRGNGQFFSLESNYARVFDQSPLGIESAVYFANAFYASKGWNSIGGSNFNRLRTAFEVDPIIRLAAGPANADTAGLALGVQLFRHHEDESIIPEVAVEAPTGEPVFGFGLRYQRKLSPRTFVEAVGVFNISDDPQYEREGAFVSYTIIF